MSTELPELRWHRLDPGDPGYPRRLAELTRAPSLSVCGGLDSQAAMVAIVGARRATPYGEEVAFEMSAELAAAGLVIVSGLARGIDSAAHRGALESGGTTVAVMGTGPDTIYPYRHRDLAIRISSRGALVTQFPPGTPPRRANFPARNAVISGMCIGVVVVEAAKRSGAMLTAGSAGHQNRQVMAVPGNVFSPVSAGCHDLLRDGAVLVTSAADVIELLADPSLEGEPTQPPAPRLAPPRFGDVRDDLVGWISARPLTLDQLCERADQPPAIIARAVAQLRLDGLVVLQEGVYRPSGGIQTRRFG